MNALLNFIFVCVEGVSILLTLLVILRLGLLRLESRFGIWNDGLKIGQKAPAGEYITSDRSIISIPSQAKWQLLLFVDHSLASFTDLVLGVHHLTEKPEGLEILMVARRDQASCQSIAQNLGLKIPIIPVEHEFYTRYRVRVMPFVTILDPQGKVFGTGLVNTEEQLFLLWKTARIRSSQL
jgi:hypothetical protein